MFDVKIKLISRRNPCDMSESHIFAGTNFHKIKKKKHFHK